MKWTVSFFLYVEIHNKKFNFIVKSCLTFWKFQNLKKQGGISTGGISVVIWTDSIITSIVSFRLFRFAFQNIIAVSISALLSIFFVLSKGSDSWALICFKKAAWISNAWVSSVLVTLCACHFYHWSDYHFNISIYQVRWSSTFNLFQERCVNARCLGFPASLWRYTHFLSTIEAGIIMTCRILRHGSCRSRIYWSTSDNLIFQKLQFFSHSTVEPLFRSQFAYVWFCF